MSCNVTALWPGAIFCAADRRLTDFEAGKITTNRSTKMSLFTCADAHGVITYNGIGSDQQGNTPSDWLLEIKPEDAFQKPLSELLADISADLETRLRSLAAVYGWEKVRHSFVVAAWVGGKNVVYMLSNYESVEESGTLAEGKDSVTQSKWEPTVAQPAIVIATGANPSRDNLKQLWSAMRLNDLKRVRFRGVKAIRDISLGRQRGKGTVGASVQWCFLPPTKDEAVFGLDVAGGARSQETPNLLYTKAQGGVPGTTMTFSVGGPFMFIKGMWVSADESSNPARYDRVRKKLVYTELNCGLCGAPWPASNRVCELCLAEASRKP